MISWICRKHASVAQSSTKAEYIVAAMASREVVWLRKLLVGLFGQPMDPTIIHCDNQSCIKLSVNPVFHDRSKHIELCKRYGRHEFCQIRIHLYCGSDNRYSYQTSFLGED